MHSYPSGSPGSSNQAHSASAHRYRARRSQAKGSSRKKKGLIIALGILILLLLVYPFVEARIILTDTYACALPDFPSGINNGKGLSVVYLTDIHYGYAFSDRRVDDLVTSINTLKPDLVLFGGDYGTDAQLATRFFQKLSTIHARYGIYGVLGDTDYLDPDPDAADLTEIMEAANVQPLVNEVATVRIENTTIKIAGLDDPLKGNPDISTLSSEVSEDDFVILLCHSPSVLEEAQKANDKNGNQSWFDMALFGHTHGGQVPLLNNLLGIAADLDQNYQQGWHEENRTPILISNGIGTSVLPIRLGCFPQIHLIQITNGN